MSEPSGDTPGPIPPDPAAKPSSEAPASNLALGPRVKSPGVAGPKATPPAGGPPGMAEFMEWMKALGGAPVEEETARTGRTLIPKEQKKFSRRTAEAATSPDTIAPTTTEPSETSRQEAVPVAGEGDPGAPVLPRAAVPESYSTERKRRTDQTPKSPAVVLFTQFLLFALIVGSFFLGRITVPRSAATPLAMPVGATTSQAGKTPGILPPDLAAKVDQANVAERAHDFKRARALLEEVEAAGGRFNGLTYHLAEVTYALKDWPAVHLLLNDTITKGEKVAESYNLRGTMLGQRSGPGKGIADLQMAAQLDPFNSRFAFFVGESLRRVGKPQAAQESLRQALDRLRDPSLLSFYQLKLRMAQIEAGQEKQFAEEMTAKLALNPPPLDWLFTAAALELHRGNVSAAAGYLDQASAEATPEDMEARLRDYYFYSFSNDKTLERFFQTYAKPVPEPSVIPSPTPAAASGSLQIPTPAGSPSKP